MGIVSKKNLTYFSLIFLMLLILQRTAGILTKLILANTISPYQYGLITLVAISLPSMLLYITNFNFYEILSHSTKGNKYLGFTVFSSIILVFIISAFLLLFHEEIFSYLNIPPGHDMLFCSAIIMSLFFISIVVDFEGFFSGEKQYGLPGILMATPSLIRLFSVLILYFSGYFSFELVILIFAISNVFPLTYIVLSKRHRYFIPYIKKIRIPSKKMMIFGISVFIVGSFSLIGQNIIKIVISHNLGLEWQGYYDVSFTVVSVLIFGLMTMKFLSVPESTSDNYEKLSEKGNLGDVSRALFALIAMLSIILFFYSEFIVEFFFSEDYTPASDYISILVIGYIFLYVQNFTATVNLSVAKEKSDYFSYILIPCFFFPAFYILSEYLMNLFEVLGYKNGFVGAYISYTALIIVYTIITTLLCRDKIPLKLLFYKSKLLFITSLITLLIPVIFNPPPLLGIAVCCALFTALIFMSGYLDKKEFCDIFRKKT